MSSRPIIAVTTSSYGVADRTPIDRLEDAGYEVTLNPHGRKLAAEEAAMMLREATGVIAGTEPLNREVLSSSKKLRVVSRAGIGIDNVDLEAAAELGIAVSTTSAAHVDAVAELALAGTLACLRGLVDSDRSIRSGGWNRPMGRLLRGKTVGLVGFGRVGRRFADLLAPFDVTLLVADPAINEAPPDASLLELEPLLQRSDVVSLHLPLNAETRGLLSADRLGMMRPDSVLINCARGGLVDERALFQALRTGKLAAAHLDVFDSEPYQGDLIGAGATMLTAHIGSYAVECRTAMELEAAENLINMMRAVP